MKGKRMLAFALSLCLLLALPARAAVTPEGEDYVEVRLMAAKTAMTKAEYTALLSQMAGAKEARATIANSAFQNGSSNIQVHPGETFFLSIKVDDTHIWSPYVSAGNYNLYYSYDPNTFTFRAENGYINILAAGLAGLDDSPENMPYLGDYGVLVNSKLVSEGLTYLAIGMISSAYKYYLPDAEEWDFVLPVQVSEDAHTGTYTIGFQEKNFGNQFRYAIMLGDKPNGTSYLPDFGSVDLKHLKANDVIVEIVGGAPADPGPSGETAPSDPGEVSFTDLPQDAWYTSYALTAAGGRLMQGTGGGHFSPLDQLHTAEVVTLAARLHAQYNGKSVPASGAGEAWYQGAYDYCLENRLFTAQQVPLTSLTSLSTRFEMVDLLDRAVPEAEKAPIRTGVTVPDLARSDPYGEVVYRWYAAGITQGDQSGSFNGASGITRAETATILCRLAGLTPRITD